MNYNRISSPLNSNAVVARGLDLRLRANCARNWLKWCALNITILAVLLYDISKKCPFAVSNWYYVEYAVTAISALSALTYLLKYLYYLVFSESVQGTKEQRNLLTFSELDSSFITRTVPKKGLEPHNINSTILSWHSSFNDSGSIRGSPNWSYSNNSPRRQSISPQRQSSMAHSTSWSTPTTNNVSMNGSTLSNNVTFMSPYSKYTRDETITDEQSLRQYLKEVYKHDLNKTQELNQSINTGTINSFWNYCNTAANLLKTSLYQLAPSTTVSSSQTKGASDEGGLNIINSNSEVIKKISSEKLSQYVANLRRWMSITILQRLVKEIRNVDESFKMRGISDMQIGSIGLDRLKKIAENPQFVSHYAPMLPLIVPFLEMSTNQEYLVQRIKELAKDSCIVEYSWNSGSSYHKHKWDEHLPTDSAILFHLFCVYLDTQLMPLPQGDGGRPFYNRYVISGVDTKSTQETISQIRNKAHCAILCTDTLKPKFNFISDKELHACAYDRNNLFYVIIQFLIYMNTHHEATLEGVSLGPSGINIICVIKDLK